MTAIKQGDLVCITIGSVVSHGRKVELVSQYPFEEPYATKVCVHYSSRWYKQFVPTDECPKCKTNRRANDKTR